MSRTNKRTSLSLRLQSTENNPLGEVITYLKSLSGDEVRREVADILIMTLLPYARYHNGKCTTSELRSTCWEAQDSLDKHGSNMRFALGVEQSKFLQHSPQQSSPDNSVNLEPEDEIKQEDENISVESSTNSGNKFSYKDLDSVFDV